MKAGTKTGVRPPYAVSSVEVLKNLNGEVREAIENGGFKEWLKFSRVPGFSIHNNLFLWVQGRKKGFTPTDCRGFNAWADLNLQSDEEVAAKIREQLLAAGLTTAEIGSIDSEIKREAATINGIFEKESHKKRKVVKSTFIINGKAYETKVYRANRYVKKGETGLKVWAPIKRRPTKKWIEAYETAHPGKEAPKYLIVGFRLVTVFDISQTEGAPIPAGPKPERLTADVAGYVSLLNAIKAICPVPIRFSEAEMPSANCNGFYDPLKKEIVLRPGMSEAQTVKTAIHELAHAILDAAGALTSHVSEETREVRAEATAFTVCNLMGIDTSGYSVNYVASWSSDENLKELFDSSDIICQTADDIYARLQQELSLKGVSE